MDLRRVQGAKVHIDRLTTARESLITMIREGYCSVIEEAFILETVNRLRDIRNSARLGEEHE